MKQVSIHEMISLLERKNGYLKSFQSLNNEELEKIKNGQIDNLEAFYFDREILLNAIDRLDKSLKDCKLDQLLDVCESTKKIVLDLLVQKKKFINCIIEQDMEIHEVLHSNATTLNKERIA